MSDLRRDPVSGSWVVISPEQGPSVKLERFERYQTPENECPFCPGRESDTGPEILYSPPLKAKKKEIKWGVRVIPNRVPVLRTDLALEREGMGMFDRMTGVGAHEIVIDSPEHSLDLKDFPIDQFAQMLQAWRERLVDLHRDSRLRYVSIFKNQGRRAGARISHPHSQIIATPMIPITIRDELESARGYFKYKERCLFMDLIGQELEAETRLVLQSRGFVVFCPFASRFPFEMWVLPRRQSCNYGTVVDEEIQDLAEVLSAVSKALALSLLDPDLNLILKTAPNPDQRRRQWMTLEDDFLWHLEIIPRIFRPCGYEAATGMYVNPTPPEEAAASLRESLSRVDGRRGHG
jgi:UDPglucose--hexose-1-phosphate uridylyltransferase